MKKAKPGVKVRAMLTQQVPVAVSGKWSYKTERFMVEVLATSSGSGYAMVRRPGCYPFIARLNELEIREVRTQQRKGEK